MLVRKLTNTEKQIPRTLFISIIIMLVPFIICFTILDLNNVIIPLLAGVYFVQIFIISNTFINGNIKIRRLSVCIVFGILFSQFITLLIDVLAGIKINTNDYINIFAKTLNFILYFEVMANVKVSKLQIQCFMRYFTLFAVVAIIYNFALNWTELLKIQYITSSYVLELKSFFPNRNQFGAFLFISIIAHCYFCSGKKIQKSNILIFTLQILSIVLTMSRGAILACAVFFVILYLQHSNNLKVFLLSIVLSCNMIILITCNNKLMEFISKFILRSGSGTTGRTEIWKMGIGVAVNNNIVNGVGYYTGTDLARAQGFQFDQFHSLFIDAIVSGGIIELSFIVLVLINIYRQCIKNCVDNGYKKIYIGSMVAILPLGIFESISFFSIGYTDSAFSIFFISIPLLLSNMSNNEDLSVRQTANDG